VGSREFVPERYFKAIPLKFINKRIHANGRLAPEFQSQVLEPELYVPRGDVQIK
jgi:hypothetical protein